MPAKSTIKEMSKRPLLRVVSGDLREMGLQPREAALFHEMDLDKLLAELNALPLPKP